MKITRRQLRGIIQEELGRALRENDPFADLDVEFARLDKPDDKSLYPADEAEAKAAVPKMYAELDAESDPFKDLDISIKYGLVKQDNDVFTFNTRDGGRVTVTVPGFRKK